MPLWNIYHPPSTFTDPAKKRALAQAITKIYTSVPLPAFYVNVLFIPVEPSSFYIGGVARGGAASAEEEEGAEKPFIQITMRHIARKFQDKERSERFMKRVDEAIWPFVGAEGYDWEYSVEETSRDLWKIQGLAAPMPGSEAEKEWVRENKPIPFEREKGGL